MARIGRPPGSRNLRKLKPVRFDKELAIAERAIATSHTAHQLRLGKELMSTLANHMAALTTWYQPARGPRGEPVWGRADLSADKHLELYLSLFHSTILAARSVAPYESPTYKAIMIHDAPMPLAPEQRPIGEDGNVVQIDVVREYRRIVCGRE